ncbi:MAG: hypothetical protein H6842_10230 [Rhodospirillaceae bacterium]|nr:hypothetical protein [Rhodospirillaceae bacterium]
MRGLKLLVISMAVLIVAGFVVLVSELGSRVAQLSVGDGATPASIALALPAGSSVEGIAGTAERLAIHIRLADGTDRIYLIDPATGAHVATIEPGTAIP